MIPEAAARCSTVSERSSPSRRKWRLLSPQGVELGRAAQGLAGARVAGAFGRVMDDENRCAVTAEAVARKLGIDEIEADMLPDQKADVIAELKSRRRVVEMAGGGINDARLWQPPMWASPWAPEPMSRSRAPA